MTLVIPEVFCPRGEHDDDDDDDDDGGGDGEL